MAVEPFPPVPDTIPLAIGFWDKNGEHTGWSNRQDWVDNNIATDRRRRLVACALARRSLPVYEKRWPDDTRPRNAIEVVEQYAEGNATAYAADAAYAASAAAYAAAYAADAAAYAADAAAYAAYAANLVRAVVVERMNQSRLLSLVVALSDWDAQWHSLSAVGLAEAIYAERAFDRLPILADALEEAGCDHPWLLTALRDERMTSWYRGMWFLDRLRGTE